MNQKIKVCSLFSGIGGFEWGIKKALGEEHVELVFSSEIDKYASAAFTLLHGLKPTGDIMQIEARDIPDHDVLVGGFPCQAFSIAGKREGFEDKTRGTLFFDVARIIKEKQPKFFVLENVKGLVNHDKGKTFEIIKETLLDLGYQLHFKVLNTKNFGLPQNRERIFIIGSLNVIDFHFPEGIPLEKKLKDVLEDEVEEKFYLKPEQVGKFKPKQNKKENEITFKGNIEGNYARTSLVYDKGGISPTILTQQQGKNGIKIIVEGNLEQKGQLERLKRVYSSEVISPTLTCRSDTGKVYIDGEPFRIRKLTPLECFRLQGFPDEAYYELKEHNFSNTQLYKMSGNAVSVNVIEALFNELKPYITEERKDLLSTDEELEALLDYLERGD